jgi:hypothetical protein
MRYFPAVCNVLIAAYCCSIFMLQLIQLDVKEGKRFLCPSYFFFTGSWHICTSPQMTKLTNLGDLQILTLYSDKIFLIWKFLEADSLHFIETVFHFVLRYKK